MKMGFGVFTDSEVTPKQEESMKKLLVIITLCLFCSGCYPGIKGTVVDGLTGQPLERALVVAQWTKKHGLWGMQYHDLYKVMTTRRAGGLRKAPKRG